MGIRAWYDVWCDDPDCLQWTTGGSDRAQAAQSALRAGWEGGRGWRCPDHRRRPRATRRGTPAVHDGATDSAARPLQPGAPSTATTQGGARP